MNNSVGSVPAIQYLIQGIQVLQGFGLSLTNLLLLSTILYHQSLRDKKEYVVILGVALSDLIFSFGLFRAIYNIYRLSVFGGWPQMTRQDCLLSLNVFIYVFSMPAQGLMLVVQTVDRLLAVASPYSYFGFETSYAWKMVCIPFILSGVQTFVIFLITWGDQTTIVTQNCIPKTALDPFGFLFWNHTHTAYGVVAVVLYGVVAVLYRRHIRKVMPEVESTKKSAMKAQTKMILSMGISAVFTLFLFVLPRLSNLFFILQNKHNRSVQMLGFVLYNCNPVVNLFIYMKRHREVRMGFMKMFKREELPGDLEQYTTNNKSVKLHTNHMESRA